MRRWPYLIAAVVLSILEISFFPFLKGMFTFACFWRLLA